MREYQHQCNPGLLSAGSFASCATNTDKVAFCEQYGIQITEEQWPCKGLPRALAVDNGELISKASNAIIEGLGITVKNEPAWRPDLKGIVESRFRLLNLETKAKLPGSVLPDFRQRGAPDYRLDATLTLTDFTKIVIYFVLDHNRRQMERHPQPLPDILKDSVPAIPLALWQWGITHRAGSLRQMEPELLQVALSQRAQATVTPRGIKFHALFYQCETAMEENWFSTARIKRGWKIDIAYHPSAKYVPMDLLLSQEPIFPSRIHYKRTVEEDHYPRDKRLTRRA